MKIIVLIPHARGSQTLTFFFLLLTGYDLMKFTDLLLHVCLVSGNRAELCIDVLIDRVQFVYNFWIKNSLTNCLRLNFVEIVSMNVLILSVREVSVVWCGLVIIVYFLILFRIILNSSRV